MPAGKKSRRPIGAARTATSRTDNRGRAVPGRVPRGSVPPRSQLQDGFSDLGRFILDRLSRGVILLDRGGRVIDLNAFALALIDTRDGISIRNQQLNFTDKTVNARVSLFLKAVNEDGPEPVMTLVTHVRRPGRQRPHQLVMLTVPSTVSRSPGLVAFLYPGDGGGPIARELLRELYSLTRAEAEVAARIFAGASVEQVSDQLEISPNTVRTHLKRIFQKCDVSSRAELIHLLAQGPVES